MKRIIIARLEDDEAKRIVTLLVEANVFFSVAPEPPQREPLAISGPAAAAVIPPPLRGLRHIQKRTADGRTPRQVVMDKVASFNGRKFHYAQVSSIAQLTGFAESTLRGELQNLVRLNVLEKVNRWHFRAVVEDEPADEPAVEQQLQLSS